MGEKRGRVFSHKYKGHMDKTKCGVGSGEGGTDGWFGGQWWGKNGDNCT